MANRFSVSAIFKAVDKMSAPVTRMQNRVQKFTQSTSRGLRRVSVAFRKFTGFVGRTGAAIASLGGKMVAFGAAGVGGLTTLITLLSKADVEAQTLARSVGFNVDELEALSSAVKGAGFNFDNVVDLIEEMNNKLGESAGLEQITPVKESLQILGLSFEKINKLSPEKQFKAITNAALAMADAQKAAAAADILLGGEANKIIGVLRQQGKSVDEIINKYLEFSFRTKESREGSKLFMDQFKKLSTAIGSVTKEVSGLVAGGLSPLIEKMVNWVKLNKELIATKIVEFTDKISNSIQNFIQFMVKLDQQKPIFERVEEGIQSITSAMGKLSIVLSDIISVFSFFKDITGFIIKAGNALIDKFLMPFKAVRDVIRDVSNFGLNVGSGIGNLFNGNDDNTQAQTQNTPNIVSPEQRTISMINSIEKNQTEITIKDETGRAEMTKGKPTNNIKLQATGAF